MPADVVLTLEIEMNANNVQIITSFSQNQLHDLMNLYQNEFWCNDRNLADVEVMLSHTDIVLGLINEQQRLIGFARVLTDYVYKATIYDLIVHPAYRGDQLGKLLMDEIINHPKLSNVEHFDLNCLPLMLEFYKRWGFSDDIGEIIQMRRCK